MAFKYAVEAWLIHFYTGKFFAPHDFLNPLLSMRQQFLVPPAPEWLGWVLLVWTLPFLWIATLAAFRQMLFATVVSAAEWLVFQAEQMEQRGLQIVGCHLVVPSDFGGGL